MDIKELIQVLQGYTQADTDLLKDLVLQVDEVILIGNGGSNAIASHMAVDYTKFLNKRCYVPNASDLLSMIVNDYGKDDMFAQYIKYHYNTASKQLAILISSSGNSVNVYNAAKTCTQLNIPMVLLSGFDRNNKLATYESPAVKYKLWVNSDSYGVVEMAHHVFLHSIV